jgi:hypothetical protein
MRFRVLRSFCLKPGQDVYEGDLLELEDAPGRRWERLGFLAPARESEPHPETPDPAAPGPARDALPEGARDTDIPTEGARRRRRPS